MSVRQTPPETMSSEIELPRVSADTPKSDLPDLTVAYHDASVGVDISSSGPDIKTVMSPLIDLARAITHKAETRTLWRVRNASGCIKPGSMTLILAPPGHGKSTLLRLMSDRIRPNKTSATTGVRYNGLSVDEAAAQGCSVRRLCHHVDQIDEHLPLITVRETLDFAHECTSMVHDPTRVDSVIRMLGLEECQNTIIGDALIRGVSGGQKRRVTVGEMLVGDARAVFLDEYTNGLDTATAEDITRGLRKWARDTNGSVVTTAQQPTPGLFAEYDDIIILNNAEVVYHGPREDVVPFFASMGFNCPDDVDVCDFIIDCVSQPRVAYERLLHTEARAKCRVDTGRDPTAMMASTKGQLTRSAAPCLTVAKMLAHYRASPFYAEILRAISPYFPALELPATIKAGALSPSDVPPLVPSALAKATYATGFVQPIGTLMRMVTARQIKVVRRNESMLVSRVIMAVVMGLIFGSVYYLIPSDKYFFRIASFLMAAGQVSFCNFAELSQVINGFRHSIRQSGAGFYPAWAGVLATTFAITPFLIFETAILAIIMYFMGGNYVEAGTFFTYFALLLVQNTVMSHFFRLVGALTLSEAAVFAISGPINCVTMILGGFFVSMNSMPVFMRWLMWLSPFSWTVRAMANNEYLSAQYDTITASGRRLGDVYLDQLDMKIGDKWIGFSVLVLISVTLILLAWTSWVLDKPIFESSIGTRRTEDDEVPESEADTAAEDKQKEHDAAVEDEIAAELEGNTAAIGAAAHEVSRMSNATSIGADSTALKTLREALPFTPVWLSFKDLHYTVKVPGPEGGLIDRPLLRGVNGYAEPGKLTALMGASGAGKTTLLDVLAGRKNTGVVEGKILLNGQVPSSADVAYHTGYVEQFDTLFPFDTVHETLLFAARMRLPASVPDEIKIAIVDEVLDILELTSIRGYIIGNYDVVGLSPSQLKRVNIGCELVANPAILFLDEPTTGLDSRAAQTVMRVVRRIARSGRSVICTIHQPSAELFYLFDRLVLLASGGHQVFFGSLGVRCKHFIPYIQSVEGVSKCPPRYNPASWMLEEMGVGQTNTAATPEASTPTDTASVPSRSDNPRIITERFKTAWHASRQYAVARELLCRLEKVGSGHADPVAPPAETGHIDAGVLSAVPVPVVIFDTTGVNAHTGSLDQPAMQRGHSGSEASSVAGGSVIAALPTAHAEVHRKESLSSLMTLWLLQKRMLFSYWRSPRDMYIRFAICTGLSVVFGLIYFDMKPDDEASVQSLLSAIAVSSQFVAIMISISAMPLLLLNRSVLYRELASDMYPAWVWAITSFFNEAVWCALLTFMAQIPNYFLVGLDSNGSIFFRYWLASFLLMVAYCGMACFLAAFCPNMAVAGVVQTMYLSVLNIFNGISTPLPATPKGWVWVFRLSFVTHATQALVMDQFATCSPLPNCGPMIEIVEGTETTTQHLAAYVQKSLDFGYDGYGEAIGWMILFIVVSQLLCVVGITKLNFSKR